jgi:hypothetical protein
LEADGEGSQATGSLRVRVREGTVLLTPDTSTGSDSGVTYTARVGEELRLTSEGRMLRGTSPIHGNHWDWVIQAAPLPDVEGESLQSFLSWLGREGGWNVRFADDRVAGLATETVLHGDLSGMTATEAASRVLRSSGLAFSVKGDELVIAERAHEPTP